ncbi:PucR family transcriptional regulator [Georgenia ruanii]|uniref:PucR family transcriptional regulator n=1 Tax=Georgenia ruanii TaxID=348442 RepID=A0A7J9USP0_9MICO|nr:helix-turn-helix domain-containing protein [Georgenia ruanii]MPV87637.1 hypothetical protein [Georgenia ruanii]
MLDSALGAHGKAETFEAHVKQMSEDIEVLVERVFDRVSRLPEYSVLAGQPDGRRYMRDGTRFLIRTFCDRLRGVYREVAHVDFVHRASKNRAESGVPAQTVLYSYQVASRVLWDWLFEQESTRKAGDPVVGGFWSAWMAHVDRATRAVLDAYIAAASVEAVSTSTIRWQFLLDFIGGELAPETLTHRLNAIGFARSKSYVLVVVGAGGQHSAVPSRMAHLGGQFVQSLTRLSRGAPPCVAVHGHRAVILVSEPRVGVDAIKKAVLEVVQDEGDSLGIVVSREVAWTVPGQQVFAQLDAVARTVRPGEAVYVDDLSLVDHAASRLHSEFNEICPPELRRFVSRVFGDHPEWLETVDALVTHNLNVRDAAKELFVHPNTIYYRIDQIKQQVGIDPTAIRTLMDMRIAIRLASALEEVVAPASLPAAPGLAHLSQAGELAQ